ncbi:hypothetical protein [Ralstonia pseudosolanacearum]|uniref:hypothetical protein n=1 Tax=Ralstonia pseudosolanacearum TaxID=1310165 RepID=UPI0022345DE4|nr:hypothetical protein [Ralstonia sp. RS647]UZF35814.1 hypothetical protein LGV81_03790 [Ralstonia sp. RS647]
MAELFKPRAFVRQLEAALDAMFLPELAAGLGPEGQVQFNVAENLVAECQHPQRDLSLVTGGERLQRFWIVLTCAPELGHGKTVGHQVNPPQVVGPQ